MIWDVLDWIKKQINEDNISHSNWYDLVVKLGYRDETESWKELRKPIEDQSKECIDFIYWLIV